MQLSRTTVFAFALALLSSVEAASRGIKGVQEDKKPSNVRRELKSKKSKTDSEDPEPSPTPSPTKKLCFSGENTVEVLGQGMVPMSNLKIGDFVKAGDNKFTRVYSFSHIEEFVEADYLQIISEAGALEISPEHMVFAERAIPASQVKVGDMLGDSEVLEIKSVKRTGAYAPVTVSGDIIVSGVLASSYVALLEYSAVNQHKIAHAAMAPHRLACHVDFTICEGETYDEYGMSNSGSAVIRAAQALAGRGPLVQIAVTAIAAPILAAAYTTEQCITAGPSLATIFAGLVALLLYKKNKSSKIKGM